MLAALHDMGEVQPWMKHLNKPASHPTPTPLPPLDFKGLRKVDKPRRLIDWPSGGRGGDWRAQRSMTDWKPESVPKRSPLCGPKINKGLSITQLPAIDKGFGLQRQLTLYRGHCPEATIEARFLPTALLWKLLNKNIKVS